MSEELTKVESSQQKFEIPLLRIAQILHEYGDEMAPNIAETFSDDIRQYAKLGALDRTIGIFNHERMCNVSDDGMRYGSENPGESRTTITLFLGPQTEDQVEYVDYPRVAFFYKGDPRKPESLQPWGYQVGVRGHMIGTRFILRKVASEGKISADLIETKLDLDDVERILSPFVDSEKNQEGAERRLCGACLKHLKRRVSYHTLEDVERPRGDYQATPDLM